LKTAQRAELCDVQDIKLIMPTVLILLFTIFIMVTVIPYAFSSGITNINDNKTWSKFILHAVTDSTTANLYYTSKATALQQRPASRGLISRHFIPPPPIYFPAILFSRHFVIRHFVFSPIYFPAFFVLHLFI
jgi:hypothetical protein